MTTGVHNHGEAPDRFADYVSTKRETADALRAVLASDIATAGQSREQLRAAVQAILDAGTATGTLRDDVHAEDIVATLVGMFTTTSLTGRPDQLGRMLDLLMDAVRHPAPGPGS
ncbi:SbtR family transcriptional regulator [Streptomyces mirabilis]|uniref:SbtR family transcriptional regulator n=1 Tax=Streptomyces mirabilis TaxID=68239 RepID=UPI0036518228